jgi:hypothetical protein
MKFKAFICLLFFTVHTVIQASPKVLVKHQRNTRNLAEVQVINQTIEMLICYAAIDGHKIFFRLPPRQPSQWYVATDERFNHTHFSTWCDYLSLHPKYQ